MQTLGMIIAPDYNYWTDGKLFLVFQNLIASSSKYRDAGRWGESGPHEILVGYGGCTNCLSHGWHSSRRDCVTLESHILNMKHCMISALCSQSKACRDWRKSEQISLDMEIKIPMSKKRADECEAFKSFFALNGTKLPVASLNEYHRCVNVLCYPELVIHSDGVFLNLSVTQRGEFKQECGSRWDIELLSDVETPKWNHLKEGFAEFVLRGINDFKSAKKRTR